MKNSKKLICLLLAAIMIFAFAACGSDPAPAASPEAPEVSEAPEAPEAPAEDSDAAYIMNNGKLVIGITMYPPMNFYGDDGALTGFDTEVAQAVCDSLGIEAEFVEINWDSKEIELNAKNIDCLWNGMCITEERKENMSISSPYMYNDQALVMKADREEEIMASVDGLTLTAEAGSTGEGKYDGSIADDGTEDISAAEYLANVNYIPSDSMAKALMEVKSGTADFAIVDSTLGFYSVGEGTDFEDLVCNNDLNFGSQQFGIAFRKGSDFTQVVNGKLAELLADGTLDEIASHYGLEDALVR